MTLAKWGITILMVCGLGGAAVADELDQETQETIAEAIEDEGDPFAALPPMDTAVLGEQRGGVDTLNIAVGDVAINAAKLDAVNENNTVINSTSGDIYQNTISDPTGVNAFMFNTGSNVNMNSSIQVNVFME